MHVTIPGLRNVGPFSDAVAAYLHREAPEQDPVHLRDPAGFQTMTAAPCLFTSISSWNNSSLPPVFILGRPELRTVGLYAFTDQTTTHGTPPCAGAVISLAPIVVVFVVAPRHIVEAIAGAVKARPRPPRRTPCTWSRVPRR
ncbi:hypothetical protein ACIBF1_32450 [Spirillospora sp. NPDC050679]